MAQLHLDVVLQLRPHLSYHAGLLCLEGAALDGLGQLGVGVDSLLLAESQLYQHEVVVSVVNGLHGKWLNKLLHVRHIELSSKLPEDLNDSLNNQVASLGGSVLESEGIAELVDTLVLGKDFIDLFVESDRGLRLGPRSRVQGRGL